MKRLRRHGLHVAVIALVVAAAAIMSGTMLSGGRALQEPGAEAGLDGEVLDGSNVGREAESGRDHTARSGHRRGQENPVDDHGEAASNSDGAASAAPQTGTPTTVTYGPFVLPPAPPETAAAGQPVGGIRIGEVHLNFVLREAPKPCNDCFLTTLRPDLVYPDGRPANLDTGVMLHHAVWFQAGQPDVTCGPETVVGRLGQRFFASGNERTGATLVPGFGYHVDGSSWTLLVELMNHTNTPKTVNLRLDATWLPNSPDTKPVTPIWLDVDNCRDSQYSAPAGPSRTQWRWTSARTGRLISAAGHLHDGGVKAVLTNHSSGRTVCTSFAAYGRNPAYRGSIESMSACNWDAIGTVHAGEVLTLDSYYNLPAPRHDVMGIMLAYLYETTDLTAGTPPPERTEPEPTPS
ncbi:MAG: hypothetical protein ABR592_13025, partial [Nitriliruptorales bacterium]